LQEKGVLMKIPKKILDFLRKYSKDKNLPEEYKWPVEKITKKDINRLKKYHESIHEAFVNFAENSDGKKEDIDLLIELQHEYRTSFTWNNDFDIVFKAGGYLGHKFNLISDYIYERIVSTEPDEIDYKYFLVFCLTIAARTNPHATELWWNLWKYADISETADLRNYRSRKLLELKRSNYPYEFVQIEHDATRGLPDSNKYFDNVSIEVIKYILSRMIMHGDITNEFRINEIFGKSPIVNCIEISGVDKQTKTTIDLSGVVTSLIRNSELLPSLNFIFLWCKNDLVFRKQAFSKLEEVDTTISYMISFLKNRIARIDYDIKNPDIETLKFLCEKKNRQFSLEDEINGMIKSKKFFEKSINRLESSDEKLAELLAWEDALHKFGADSGAGDMFDFIDTVKTKFVKCSYLGSFSKY